MASFSHLPNEVVCEIAKLLSPEEIESFSLVSKGIFAVTWGHLEEHRRLKRKYGNFEDIIATGAMLGDTFSEFIADVLKNQRVRQYITAVGLYRDDHDVRLDGFPPGDEHIQYTEEQTVLFKQALSTYILPEKLRPWIKQLEGGNSTPMIALLLILLPNLHSIEVSDPFCGLRHLIERIKTNCVVDDETISHLEQLDVHGNDYRTRVDVLAFMSTMQSLTPLRNRLVALRNGLPVSDSVLLHASDLASLAFKARATAEEIRMMIGR